jgi:hypothetical protein
MPIPKKFEGKEAFAPKMSIKEKKKLFRKRIPNDLATLHLNCA